MSKELEQRAWARNSLLSWWRYQNATNNDGSWMLPNRWHDVRDQTARRQEEQEGRKSKKPRRARSQQSKKPTEQESKRVRERRERRKWGNDGSYPEKFICTCGKGSALMSLIHAVFFGDGGTWECRADYHQVDVSCMQALFFSCRRWKEPIFPRHNDTISSRQLCWLLPMSQINRSESIHFGWLLLVYCS